MSIGAAQKGYVDILIVADAYIHNRLQDDAPRDMVLWGMFARFFGLRLASAKFLVDRGAASVQFVPAKSRRKTICIHERCREHNSQIATFLKEMCGPRLGPRFELMFLWGSPSK